MNPLLHWGNSGIIKGFHFLDPLGGLGLVLRQCWLGGRVAAARQGLIQLGQCSDRLYRSSESDDCRKLFFKL